MATQVRVFNYGSYDIIFSPEYPNNFLKRMWIQAPDPNRRGELMQMGVLIKGENEKIVSTISFGQPHASYIIESEIIDEQFKKLMAPPGEIELVTPKIIT